MLLMKYLAVALMAYELYKLFAIKKYAHVLIDASSYKNPDKTDHWIEILDTVYLISVVVMVFFAPIIGIIILGLVIIYTIKLNAMKPLNYDKVLPVFVLDGIGTSILLTLFIII